jgi:hypothetical protein
MDRIETIVVVTDKGSQTFQKVGSSAEKMGTSIDKAGKTGEQGLNRLSKAGAAAGAESRTGGQVGTFGRRSSRPTGPRRNRWRGPAAAPSSIHAGTSQGRSRAAPPLGDA